MQSPLLEVKNLETHFRTEEGLVKAVDDVSLPLGKGETLGIVGESGSGKSVSALSVMRLIPSPPGKIVGGEIWFDSPSRGRKNLVSEAERDMRHYRGNEIAMIFQEPMTSLNPVYTCGNQVSEAIMLHKKMNRKDAREQTLELFKEVQLPRPEKILDAYPHEVSGGQKQRVMIAMAMCCNPSILIADEPTTALDVTVQATILNLMRELRDTRNMSILFITHDLGVIAEIADHVIVMYQGKIVETGTVWEIFTDPKHPYTRGLLACRPRLDVRMKVLPTVGDFMELDAKGNLIEKKKTVEQAIQEVVVTAEETGKRNQFLKSQEPILSIINLKTYFPIRKGIFGKTESYVKAVDDVTFDVYPGEVVGLVGESGCGKTTLGRTILRLVEPTEGEIFFRGTNITTMDKPQLRELRTDIQIIFQDPYSSLNPRLTIGSAITEPMRVHGLLSDDKERKRKSFELLERVNLNTGYFNRYPHEFSGGQRQRICIARALAVNPQFLICDESVSALDVSIQAQVLNLLNELKQEFQLTYIFISHDLSVVKFMSDRMVVMNDGKIEEMGYSDSIYGNPGKEYTRKLINAIPKGKLEDIKRSQEHRKTVPG